MIEFTIKTLESINHQFSVEDETTVAQLKEQIRDEMGIEIGMQRLIFCGRVLTDDRQLSEFGVNGKVIHLVPRPPPSPQSRTSSRNPRQEMREAINEAQRVIDRMSHQPNNVRPAPRHIWSLDSPPDLVFEQHQATSMSPTSTRLEFIRRTLDDIRNTLTALFNEMGNRSGDATRPPAEPMETETSPPTETVPNETSPTETTPTKKPPTEKSPIEKLPTEMAVPEMSLPESASNGKVPSEKPTTETAQNDSHPTETPSTRQEDEDMVEDLDNYAYTSRRMPTRRGPLRPLRPSLFRPRDLAQLVDELDQLHEEFAPFRSNYLNILRETTSTQLTESERVRRQNIIELVCDVMHSFAHAYHAVSDINVSVGERFPRLSADFSSSRHQHAVPVQAHINVIPTVRQPTDSFGSRPVVRIGSTNVARDSLPTPLVAAFRSQRLASAAASAAASVASAGAARDPLQNPSHTTTGRDTTQATRNYPEPITYQVEIETRVPVAVPIDANLLNNLVAVATNLQQGQILLSQQNAAGQQGLRQEQSQAQGQGQAQAQSRSQAQPRGQDQTSAETARPRSLMDIESLLRTLSQAHPGIEVEVMSMEEIHPLETTPSHYSNDHGPSEFSATIYGTLGDGPNLGPNRPDAHPNVGSNASPNAGPNMGPNARSNAGSNVGSNAAPNTDSNAEPNARPSGRPNARPGAGPKKRINTDNNLENEGSYHTEKPCSKDHSENMSRRGWRGNSYSNPTTSNTTPSTETATRPATTPGSQPTTTTGAHPTTGPGTLPTMGPGTQTTTGPGVRPATGYNMPPFGDIRGLRVGETRPPTFGTMILDGPPGPHGFPNLPGFGTFGPIGPGGAPTFTPGVGVAAYGPASVTLQPDGGVYLAPVGSNNTGGLPGDVLQNMLSTMLQQAMNTAGSTGANAAPSDTTATTTAPTNTSSTTAPNNTSTTAAPQFSWIPITSSFTSTTVAPNYTWTTGTQTFAWSSAVPLNGWSPMTPANASAPTNSTTAAPTNTTTTAPTNATTTAPTNTSTSASQSFRIPFNAVPSFTPASYATFNMNPYENAEGRSSDGVWGISAGQEYPNVLHLESISMSPGPGQERVGPLTAMARARTVQQAEQRRRAQEHINNMMHDNPNERQRQSTNNARQHRLALNCMVYDRFLNCDSVHARHRLVERRASYQLQNNDQTRQRVPRPNAPDIDLLEQRNYRFTTRHMAIMMRLLSGPISREGRLNAFMVAVARVLFLEPEGRVRTYDPVSMPREFLFVRMQMREYIQRVVNTVVMNGPEYNVFDAIAAVIIQHNQGFLVAMRDYTSIDPLCAPLTTLRCWLRERMPIVIACIMSESTSDAFVTRFYDVITRFYIDLCALIYQFCVSGFDGFRTLYTAFVDNATAEFEVTSREWIRLLASENLQAVRNMLDPANPTNFFNRYDIFPRSRAQRPTVPVSTPPLPPARDDTPDTADSLPSTSIPTMSSSSEASESPQPPETEDASPPLDDDGGSGADTVSTTSHNSIPRSPVQMRSAATSPRHNTPPVTVQSEQNGAKDQNGQTEQPGAAALPRPISQASTVPGSPEPMEFGPPMMILEHWGEEWVPVFTRDRAELERTRTQEPFSDAYLSGMPSRKRRCLRASRPPTTLDGFMNESIREATDRAASLDQTNIRSVLRDSVRSLVRTRADTSEDYDPARYISTARFLDQTKRNKKESEPTD